MAGQEMANETMTGLLSLIAGASLGLFFYGGLWWTVLKGVTLDGGTDKRPALWFLGSQFLRTATVLTGFYFISAGDWKRLLLCFLGFLIGRVVVTRLTRVTKVRASHAP